MHFMLSNEKQNSSYGLASWRFGPWTGALHCDSSTIAVFPYGYIVD